MSEAQTLGLAKLTEYLNQTRRQAEAAIDALNEKIFQLRDENENILKECEKFQSERDYFRNYAEQLKLENSKKWRLQERDDWKSLVESVQKDRSRLQDECLSLESLLEEANRKIILDKGEIKLLREKLNIENPNLLIEDSINNNNNINYFESNNLYIKTNDNDNENNMNQIQEFDNNHQTPTKSNGEQTPTFMEGSPRAITKQLKLELEKTHSEMEIQRLAMENERLSQEAEINRLRQELLTMRNTQTISTYSINDQSNRIRGNSSATNNNNNASIILNNNNNSRYPIVSGIFRLFGFLPSNSINTPGIMHV